jgi:hypothetical protein
VVPFQVDCASAGLVPATTFNDNAAATTQSPRANTSRQNAVFRLDRLIMKSFLECVGERKILCPLPGLPWREQTL